jgi:hypothetical protein
MLRGVGYSMILQGWNIKGRASRDGSWKSWILWSSVNSVRQLSLDKEIKVSHDMRRWISSSCSERDLTMPLINCRDYPKGTTGFIAYFPLDEEYIFREWCEVCPSCLELTLQLGKSVRSCSSPSHSESMGMKLLSSDQSLRWG